MKKILLLLLLIPNLSFAFGGNQSPSHTPDKNQTGNEKGKIVEIFKEIKFNPSIGEPMSVETGESIFTEGTFIEGKKINIPLDLDFMMPGAFFIPFPVEIQSGDIYLTEIYLKYSYFCSPLNKANASFPGLGSVVVSGDCIGMRLNNSTSELEWLVDNSIRNGMTSIWTKSLSQEEREIYKVKKTNRPFKVRNLKTIEFDGYYGEQLHFTFTESQGSQKESKEYTFDYDKKPTIVGIKGNIFKILNASNIELVYEWVKLRK